MPSTRPLLLVATPNWTPGAVRGGAGQGLGAGGALQTEGSWDVATVLQITSPCAHCGEILKRKLPAAGLGAAATSADFCGETHA